MHESFNRKIPYQLDTEKSGDFHKYYLFEVNGNAYRVNISRLNSASKTSWMFTLGTLSPKGTMTQFKYRQRDIFDVLSAALEIFDEWYESVENILTTVIIKLPDKITQQQMGFVSKLIKKLNKPSLEKLPITGIKDAKHKYVFLRSKKKADDAVIKGLLVKAFEEYGFKDAFPAELLDKLMLKTKAAKSHFIGNLHSLVKGADKEEFAGRIIKKVSGQDLNFLEKDEDEIVKAVVSKEEPDKVKKVEKRLRRTSIESHWDEQGKLDQIYIINRFISLLRTKEGGQSLKDLLDFISGDDRSEFQHMGHFLTACKETITGFEYQYDEDNMSYFRGIFLSIEPDFIKHLEYHVVNGFDRFSAYRYYVIKSKAVNKGSEPPFKETSFIHGFHSKLFAHDYERKTSGRIVYEGVTLHVFTALYDIPELKKFIRQVIAGDAQYASDIADGSNSLYYSNTKLGDKVSKKMAASDMEVIEYIDNMQYEIPATINSIFNYTPEQANAVKKLQSDKTKKDDVPEIYSYTGGGYTHINDGLRDEALIPMRREELIAFMEEFKKNAIKLPYDIQVSRHSNFPTEVSLHETLVDYSPLSCSLDWKVFAGQSLALRITVPKGTPVFAALGGFSQHSNEKEIILPPGSIIKPYRKVKNSVNGKIWYECVLIGHVFDYVIERVSVAGLEPAKAEEVFDE